VCVDHGRGNVLVAEQFLNGADVGPSFQQVCRKRMSKGVTAFSRIGLMLQGQPKRIPERFVPGQVKPPFDQILLLRPDF